MWFVNEIPFSRRERVTQRAKKIAEKAICRSVFFTTWHCILSAESKMHSLRLFFGDFAALFLL